MSDLLVPVINGKKVDFYKVEAFNSAPGLLIQDDNSNYLFDTLLHTKIEKYYSDKPDILIRFEKTEDDSEKIEITESTQSITMGVFAACEKLLHNREYISKWDYIVITGDVENNLSDSVTDINEKFEGVKRLAEQNKKIVFLYTSEDETIIQGYHDNHILVKRIIPHQELNNLFAEIFVFEYSEELKQKLKSIPVRSSDEFIETASYINMKQELTLSKEIKGFLITGQSNSGKSTIAYELVKYLISLNEIDDFIWITVKDLQLLNQRSYEIDRISKKITDRSTKGDTIRPFFEEQILQKIDIKKRQAIVIDNLELDIVDEILEKVYETIRYCNNINYLFVTSWNDVRKRISCDNLKIKPVGLDNIRYNDVSELCDSYFENITINYYSDDKLNEFKHLLFDRFKLKFGFIHIVLDSLKFTPFDEILTQLKVSTELFEAEKYFYKLSYDQLGLFEQIVLYSFIFAYIDSMVLFGIDIIERIKDNLRERKTVNELLITDANIEKAFLSLKRYNFISFDSMDKVTLKSDVVRYCLFTDFRLASDMEDLLNRRKSQFFATIVFNFFEEFKKQYDLIPNTVTDQSIFDVIIMIPQIKINHLEFFKTKGVKLGKTAFAWLVEQCTSVDVIKYAVENFNPDLTIEKKGLTEYIDGAMRFANVETVKYILSLQNIDILKKDKADITYFECLLMNNENVEVLKYLIEKYNIKYTDKTIRWHYAFLNPNIDIFRYLVTAGALNISEQDSLGWNIVHLATYNVKNDQIIYELYKLNADFYLRTEKGETALMLAAKNPNSCVLKALIDLHLYSDINETDKKRHSALYYAKKAKLYENIELLVEAGAK